VDFVYFVYPCPVETSRGSILLLWSFYTLFTLCPFEKKRGSICLIWTGIVFLTSQVIFVSEWPNGEFVSFCVGCILLDKITIMYCCWFHRDAVYFIVFRYSECISRIWKEPHYDMLQVSQASSRLFQCSRKTMCRFQLKEVGSQASGRKTQYSVWMLISQ
jgi:hypothetical protein